MLVASADRGLAKVVVERMKKRMEQRKATVPNNPPATTIEDEEPKIFRSFDEDELVGQVSLIDTSFTYCIFQLKSHIARRTSKKRHSR